MTGTTVLRAEHERILSVLACVRAACRKNAESGEYDDETFRPAVDFLRAYADGWHHAKEETHLFPALEAAGMSREAGPVAVMLHEHEVGRSHIRAMADGLDAAAAGDEAARAAVLQHAREYADLLEAHIQKENNILFNLADRMLSPDKHQALTETYRSAIPEGADAETGARYEKIARRLCERWKLDPDEVRSAPGGFGCAGM